MNNSTTLIKKLVLLIGDFLILEISLILTLLIRYRNEFNFDFNSEIWQLHFLPFIFVYLFWIIIFYIHNLYELKTAVNKSNFYQTLIRAYLFSAGLTVLIFYFIPQLLITPKTNLFLNIIISFGLIYLWRNLFNKTLKSSRLLSNVAIIGINKESLNLAEQIISHPQLGYKLVAFIDKDNCESNEINLPQSIKIINNLSSLKSIIEQEKIEQLIITSDIHKADDLQKTLLDCIPLKVAFVDLPTFYEVVIGKIPLTTINQIWLLENITTHKKVYYEFFKKIFDFTLGCVVLVPSIIIAPLIAIAIKIGSKGPIIFKQKRTGKNRKAFLAMKFRSMYINAEKHGPKWAQKDDPRVTPVGKFLRKSRLDEIPQLINIIRGEMSFVGPRPERPEFVQELEKEIPFYRQRLLVKPGLTGWAQIEGPAYGGSKKETLEKLQYDLYYIKNYSLFLDLSIILKTINIVLKFRGQ
ncbi:sugar transferase [Candidatus Parcubacteria bacterium]|nr:sugar transferase [Patescibacteria group bacterium]MCG2692562.1 sugar transferase [Candidatus Parcubacteria bacterium]